MRASAAWARPLAQNQQRHALGATRGWRSAIPSSDSHGDASTRIRRTPSQPAADHPLRQSPSHRRRCKSSLADLIPTVPKSVRQRVKAKLLDEAVKDDSRLWGRTRGATDPSLVVNEKASDAHRSSPMEKPGSPPHRGINGSHLHAEQGGKLMIDPNGTSASDYSASSAHITTPTALAGVNDPLSLLDHDPLDDLYLPNTTKYWPKLPPGIPTVDPFALAKDEIDQLSVSIRTDLIGTDHPVLHLAASYFFQATDGGGGGGGKKIRPLMVLLLSRALSESVSAAPSPAPASAVESGLFASPLPGQRRDLPEAQRRLAEISEMIHTASLFHDDVIDGSDTRRGAPTAHRVFGNKTAILAGDYLLARASICLARLRHVHVVETMSTIIEHLVRGEVMQMRGSAPTTPRASATGDGNERGFLEEDSDDDSTSRIQYYLRKNFYKTASLMANSCKSAALLGNYPWELVRASYQFGKHAGMAFQLVDDALDFEGTLGQLGKPSLADLKAGLATAPVLFAAQQFPDLYGLMDRKFSDPGDVERAVELVFASSGLERTKQLARAHAEAAMDSILQLGPSPHRDSLVQLASVVVARTK